MQFRAAPILLLKLIAGLGFGAGAAGAAEARVIALPPFLVEEKAQPLPWRYAEIAGMEVLSTCPDGFTRQLIANHHRLHALLAELLPPAHQFHTTAPRTLLLVDSARQPPTSPEVVARMALTAAEQDRLEDSLVPIDDGRLRRRPPPARYASLPNLRLWDRDAGVLFAIVNEREFDADRVALTPDYVSYLLWHRRPALPAWYISGVLSVFARTSFNPSRPNPLKIQFPTNNAPTQHASRFGRVARLVTISLPQADVLFDTAPLPQP
jgi:hypothetical protein